MHPALDSPLRTISRALTVVERYASRTIAINQLAQHRQHGRDQHAVSRVIRVTLASHPLGGTRSLLPAFRPDREVVNQRGLLLFETIFPRSGPNIPMPHSTFASLVLAANAAVMGADTSLRPSCATDRRSLVTVNCKVIGLPVH